jgi:hypothetical protein
MALQFAQTSGSISWQLTQSNTPFIQSSQGPDSVSNGFAWTTGAGFATTAIALNLTIAVSSNTTIDLQAQVDLLNQAQVLTKVYAIEILPSGSDCVLSPAATDPATWFFGSATDTITVKDGGLFILANTTSTAVTASTKNIKLANPSATNILTVKLVIIGGV